MIQPTSSQAADQPTPHVRGLAAKGLPSQGSQRPYAANLPHLKERRNPEFPRFSTPPIAVPAAAAREARHPRAPVALRTLIENPRIGWRSFMNGGLPEFPLARRTQADQWTAKAGNFLKFHLLPPSLPFPHEHNQIILQSLRW
jgi:hypothetical protein